ncbi:MAG: GGDEF domain-containing protein, partial [Sphingobium sp.]
MHDQKLTDEAGRLAALARYDILDTPAEPAFDKITRLVRTITDVPMSVVSLIDADRQWLKSHEGIAASQTPRDIAFCDHTIRDRRPMIIPGALRDARFRNNPLVTAGPRIRSYAGIPLATPDGYNIGSLCAIDTIPRDFSQTQIEMMGILASLVVDQLELRRIADRDFLSGALTRRAFLADVDRSAALFVRYRRPASLILCDIDHFKQVNDMHGHVPGDMVIRAVADLCAALKRPSDAVGRLGGEEVGIVLPETGEEEAIRV